MVNEESEQVMNKVFVGGSRKISRLNAHITQRIDRMIEKGLSVLVGDANGADKAVQLYLKDRQYGLVEVFCTEGSCRNNIGGWLVRRVPAPGNSKGFTYYEAKDKVMADEASIGFMIWDGKSLGTLMNVFRLINQRKTVVVYATPIKEFLNLKDGDDWESFLARFGRELRRRIEARMATNERGSLSSNQVRLFSNDKLTA
ncbi:MAG: hypothetical protein AB1512_24385 [Thermodesulfobacteriota bacterium]